MRIPRYKGKESKTALGVEAGLWLALTSASSHVPMHQQAQHTLAGYITANASNTGNDEPQTGKQEDK